MIAELLERGHLRAYGHDLPENLHLFCAALDLHSARARRLKADEQNQIPGIGQTLRQVMQNASAGRHPAGRNND